MQKEGVVPLRPLSSTAVTQHWFATVHSLAGLQSVLEVINLVLTANLELASDWTWYQHKPKMQLLENMESMVHTRCMKPSIPR